LIGIVAGVFRSLRGLTPGHLQKATSGVDFETYFQNKETGRKSTGIKFCFKVLSYKSGGALKQL